MNKASTWLFNPFHFIAGAKAIWLGCLLLVSSAIIATMIDARFMGVLNFHVNKTTPSQALIDSLVNLAFMVLPLWICGRFLSKTKFRILDLLGTQMLARWPLQLGGLAISSLPIMQQLVPRFLDLDPREVLGTLSILEITTLVAIGILVIALNILTITLMFNSYRISCNVVGNRAGISFGIVLILASSLSTLSLYSFFPSS